MPGEEREWWWRDSEAVARVRGWDVTFVPLHPFGARVTGSRKVMFVDAVLRYPPKEFVLRAWRQAMLSYNSDWIMKLDSDSYLNTDRLIDTLQTVSSDTVMYLGAVGHGRNNDADTYCMGMGYVMTHRAARCAFLAGPSTVPSTHPNSDIAIGHRVRDGCHVRCNEGGPSNIGELFNNNYYGVRNDQLRMREMMPNGQIDTPLFDKPPHHMYAAILVHPVKSAAHFEAFHRVIINNLRPTLPYYIPTVLDPTQEGSYAAAERYLTHYQTKVRGSCVANYAQQLAQYRRELPSCLLECARPHTLWKRFVVHSLYPQRTTLALQTMQLHDAVVVPAKRGRPTARLPLAPGEIGYRMTMRGLLQDLVTAGDGAWLIADDDIHPHRRAARLKRSVLKDAYCMEAYCSGVLMMSTSIWSNGTYPLLNVGHIGGWNLVDADKAKHASVCASGHTGVVGSVAVVYTRGVVPHIIRWMDDNADKPFDHVFGYLSSLGVPVRLVSPNVFIAALDAPSSTDPDRLSNTDVASVLRSHRWNPRDYVGYPARL